MNWWRFGPESWMLKDISEKVDHGGRHATTQSILKHSQWELSHSWCTDIHNSMMGIFLHKVKEVSSNSIILIIHFKMGSYGCWCACEMREELQFFTRAFGSPGDCCLLNTLQYNDILQGYKTLSSDCSFWVLKSDLNCKFWEAEMVKMLLNWSPLLPESQIVTAGSNLLVDWRPVHVEVVFSLCACICSLPPRKGIHVCKCECECE